MLGDRTPEGLDIHAPTATWFEIGRQLKRDPDFRFEFTSKPTKFEEFLAGAYKLQGWDAVTLTPRSGDKGRDVIAITSKMSAIRVLDQAKANSPTNLVSQNDVRAIFGVLRLDHSATKGIITTTSDFARGVADEFQNVIPYQLETKNGEQFLEWIRQLFNVPNSGRSATRAKMDRTAT
jgi:restriction system protein